MKISQKKKLLLQMPCQIGDTVYTKEFGKAFAFYVTGYTLGVPYDREGEEEYEDMEGELVIHYTAGGVSCMSAVSEIGKTVFLTREEAEAYQEGE